MAYTGGEIIFKKYFFEISRNFKILRESGGDFQVSSLGDGVIAQSRCGLRFWRGDGQFLFGHAKFNGLIPEGRSGSQLDIQAKNVAQRSELQMETWKMVETSEWMTLTEGV